MTQLDDNPAVLRRSAQLRTGLIATEHGIAADKAAGGVGRAPAQDLYGFGERINPRRSFVFVSRVLGRHVPVSPRVARQAFTGLAEQLPDDLAGPGLITSMAETAVGLGAGVHDAYLQRTRRQDVLNFSSTRTARLQPVLGRFSEDHSHASGHTLYEPALEQDQALLAASRTLVMVDDETSSGNTFRALGASLYAAGLDRFERVITLTLTDWSSESIVVPTRATASGQIEAERYSLLRGRYIWTPDPEAVPMTLPDPDVPSSLALAPVHRAGDARVGNSARTVVAPPEALVQYLHRSPDSRSVLILGTGEHVWEPFLLAEALEQAGITAQCSATTRSPILIQHDIRSAYCFRDHEGLGIRNYLYNVNPRDFSAIVLCVDTQVEQLDLSLVLALKAHVLFDNRFIEHDLVMANAGPIESATLELAAPTRSTGTKL